MKSVFSVMIVALAVVGCNSSSGGGGGAPANEVYPQGTVIGPYDQGQGPNGQYPNVMTLEAGEYSATIECDNSYATAKMDDTRIDFTFNQGGSYTQEIYNVDYRCRTNCTMIAEGNYTTSGQSITLNQTRLVNEYGGMLQGPRNNTLQIETTSPTLQPRRGKKISKAIVLRDTGSENVCGGAFRMILKKQSGSHKRY